MCHFTFWNLKVKTQTAPELFLKTSYQVGKKSPDQDFYLNNTVEGLILIKKVVKYT